MSSSKKYYLGFSYMQGIGPTRFDAMIQRFGTVEQSYSASFPELSEVIGSRYASLFVAFRSTFQPEKELSRLENQGIQVITREDALFPTNLREISDPPICLYIKGNLSQYRWEEDFFFAVVGTRNPTEYGKMITAKFSRELAENGAVIVSGMAMGVDALAHWAAIHAGKKTIAFLGCGVNIVYPAVNSHLYKEIIRTGGLIISEFPPDMRTIKGHFVARNRLISGLSKGVLVAEGLIDSGSLITARYALSQGKEVFAPPAPIDSALSRAPNLLLKEGAKLVTQLSDILEEFQMEPRLPQSVHLDLDAFEKKVYDLLLVRSCTTDELARSLELPVFQILQILSGMELAGIVQKNEIGKYQLIM